ncbi:hypothetical protein EGM_01795, partial [Macaca fascicularis]
LICRVLFYTGPLSYFLESSILHLPGAPTKLITSKLLRNIDDELHEGQGCLFLFTTAHPGAHGMLSVLVLILNRIIADKLSCPENVYWNYGVQKNYKSNEEKKDVLFTSYFKTIAFLLLYVSAGPIPCICVRSLELFLMFPSN